MILVTGATGNNGLEVLKRLASQNVQARAMVRDASGTRELARNRAKAIADLDIEMVEADFDRPETLPSALVGVDRAFLVTNSTEHAEAQQLAFVEAAKQSGVKHRVPKKDWFYSCCLFLLSVLLTVGCTGINSGSREVTSNRPTTPSSEITTATTERTDALRDSPKGRLRQRIGQIAQAAQGRVGMTATVLESGASASLNGNQHFPMQSVYKLPIAMAVLNQVDQGNLKLDQKIRIEASDIVQGSQVLDENAQGKEFSLSELLQYMVSKSDNTACDVLLRLIGEPQRVTEYLSSLGINDIVVANTEKELAQDPAVQYRNSATPAAAVVLLRTLHEGRGLSKSSQALLLQWMTETRTGLKRIKGLLPERTVVAHKTGTSSTVNGVTAATNDVGLVTLPGGQHLAIAVFVSDSQATDVIREKVIAKVARAAWDEWSR